MSPTKPTASLVKRLLALALVLAPAFAMADAAAPVPNKGDTSWMLTSTVLVILMTIPGLALFYGGMVRSKNVLSLLMQVLIIFCMCAVLWALYGYSIAFTQGHGASAPSSVASIESFLKGLTPDSTAATFSKGVVIPEYVYIVFQLTFAAITPCLIVGAFAERVKFSAILLFIALWFTFAYLPGRAHGLVLGGSRMPTPMRPREMLRARPLAFSSRRAPSTLRVARSCISTRVSRASSAHS